MEKKEDFFYTFPEFDNVKELMLYSIEKNSECRAFILKDKDGNHINITYRELKDEINYLGTAFFNLGLKEKKIAVIGKNSYMWALSYLTILFGNMIAIPLDKDLEVGELKERIAILTNLSCSESQIRNIIICRKACYLTGIGISRL